MYRLGHIKGDHFSWWIVVDDNDVIVECLYYTTNCDPDEAQPIKCLTGPGQLETFRAEGHEVVL